MSKVLLIGSKGWIGTKVYNLLINRKDIEQVYTSSVRGDNINAIQD